MAFRARDRLIVQGALEIGVAWRGETGATGRGWLAAFGVRAVEAGFLVLFHPGGRVLVLAWGIILWFVIAGIHDLVVAFSQRKHRAWNLVLGVLALIAAFTLLVSPGSQLGPTMPATVNGVGASPTARVVNNETARRWALAIRMTWRPACASCTDRTGWSSG